MPPMFTVWWLRPDRSAARVGEHNAVVWNRLKQSPVPADRKSTRLNSSHLVISYAVFCLKKKNKITVTRLAPSRHVLPCFIYLMFAVNLVSSVAVSYRTGPRTPTSLLG